MYLPVSKKTKLLIFDCDGTIANNIDIHIKAWFKVLESKNITLSTENLSNYHGLPSEVILKDLCGLSDVEIPAVANELRDETFKLLDDTKPIEPIVDLIKHYYNKIPMIVISGGKAKNVHRTLEILEIDDCFDEIITADDNHPSKNTTKAFTLLAEKYGVKSEECLVFEDGLPGLINALKAGMTVMDMRNVDLSE
ncbi:MAG: beta-phosphoglucomutase-like phosphatase (HAD superfamily) [Francisella sp.]|jgi:beta-phosphoglucomutase-like phosphatase (HAD superfamily)